MISYQPLWDLMSARGITTYWLTHEGGLSSNILHRMKQGHPITTRTIDKLCSTLGCTVPDILEFTGDEQID